MTHLISATGSTGDIDPLFVFDYVPVAGPDDHPAEESTAPAQRFTTYWEVERGCRGPQPLPEWVVTDRGAVDTDLGVLKTGKEADVFLLDRTAPDGMGVVMAAKRYRGREHRDFSRSNAYTEGRTVRRTRDRRALERKSAFGREVAATQWAYAEWSALTTYWSAGLPVPYPVQLDGTEILMEFIGDGVRAAPRLAQVRPEPDLLEHYFSQVRDIVLRLAAHHVAHGDLSAYNLLAHDERIVVIDLPQVVDLVANPAAAEFLRRDCHNACSWFVARGLDVDEDALFEEAAGHLR